jgi:hypothetical protein
MSTPTLSQTGATAATISIQVLAGATGAPAGFSLQWIPSSQFALSGWPASDDLTLCKASFSGNAQNSRFPLPPGGSTIVEVGNLFDEEPGVSFNCDELKCGTEYVFRAFAHATRNLNRSEFTPNLTASTLPCTQEPVCTRTQGYWKNHPEAWPVTALQLGTTTYTADQLLSPPPPITIPPTAPAPSILTTPAQGNGLISLAHQLIAAKLNVAAGADPTALGTAIADADALIGSLVIPPIGTGFLAPKNTSALSTTLDQFNNGATGPGHCQD